jgi:hypothetical protein
VQILSDDDPANDNDGLSDLRNALLAAGDTKNVLAASYALGTYVDEGCPRNWTREDVSGLSWYYICDGPCRKVSLVLDDFSLCPICFDTGFCGECTELLRRGTVPFGKCSPTHVKDFVYIPPRPQRVETNRVLVDGQTLTYEEWLALLKRELGI